MQDARRTGGVLDGLHTKASVECGEKTILTKCVQGCRQPSVTLCIAKVKIQKSISNLKSPLLICAACGLDRSRRQALPLSASPGPLQLRPTLIWIAGLDGMQPAGLGQRETFTFVIVDASRYVEEQRYLTKNKERLEAQARELEAQLERL